MKKHITFNCVLLLALLLLSTSAIFSAPLYEAMVYVYNQSGQPYQGVSVRLTVVTTTSYAMKTGTTNGSGYVYLYVTAPGFLEDMWVYINSTAYIVLSSQNTHTSTSYYLYPVFNLGYDGNDNDVVDAWEMPLAQKFCPVLFQPKDDKGFLWNAPSPSGVNYVLRPIPAQSMDSDGPFGQPDGILDYHDVDVDVWNVAGQFVGTYPMESIMDYAGQPYSNRYPNVIKPYDQITCTPPGKASASYTLLPHYEWATTDDHEGNISWYGKWNELYYQKGVIENDTWYVHGTMYAMIGKEGVQTKIVYAMHYPFNAAANRHEGDWPGIVVTLDSQNPSQANIVSVQFNFHGEKTIRTIPVTFYVSLAEALSVHEFWNDGNGNPAFANKYFVIDGTHPVTFGGGKTDYYGVRGWGSHAQYPCPGTWIRDKAVDVYEYVCQYGMLLTDMQEFRFNNYNNIRVLPPKHYIVNNLRYDVNYNWAIFGGFWGGVYSYPSAEQTSFPQIVNDILNFLNGVLFLGFEVIPEIPDINIAAFSPYRGSL
jgi:hypothetical protein